MNGETRSISMDQTPDRCANSSLPMLATGSRNFISTASASTPPKASTTDRRNISWVRSDERPGQAAGKRSIILVAENERAGNKTAATTKAKAVTISTDSGTMISITPRSSRLTGRNEAYYTDYRGTPQEFISAAKYGYLFQGQPYLWQEAPRGTPAFGPAAAGIRRRSSRITIRLQIAQPASGFGSARRPGGIAP